MSLKTFHIVFIIVSTLMFLGLGIWLISSYLGGEGFGTGVLGVLSICAAIGLVVYGRIFLRKLKHLSYL